MTAVMKDPQTLFDLYKLHVELAEQAASLRESLNKLYSGLVATIVAASVLLQRLAPGSETVWVLPVLGIVVSLSWLFSHGSVTGRLIAKHAVLVELERSLPFDFLTREKAEFDKLTFIRRQWSGLILPAAFLLLCAVWLATLICEEPS